MGVSFLFEVTPNCGLKTAILREGPRKERDIALSKRSPNQATKWGHVFNHESPYRLVRVPTRPRSALPLARS